MARRFTALVKKPESQGQHGRREGSTKSVSRSQTPVAVRRVQRQHDQDKEECTIKQESSLIIGSISTLNTTFLTR